MSEVGSLKTILEQLLAGHVLDRDEAKKVLLMVARQEVNSAQLAALFTIYRFRMPTIEEIEGFRSAMLDTCLPLDLSDYDCVDLCGTGGDGKDTFNISTACAFVVAACGIKVAKHGNYSFSSTSGSSNVLEKLGLKLTNDRDYVKRSIETAGVCFIHAPLFHGAFKGVQAVRKEFGLRTFLNLLGPLANPARPPRQVVGVYSLEVSRLYRHVMQRAGIDFRIVHSFEGYDELSLTGLMRIIGPDFAFDCVAKDFEIDGIKSIELKAPATIDECAALLERVVSNEGSKAQADVVVANSAVAISMYRPQASLAECVQFAREAIDSGKARECLDSVRDIK